MGTVAAKVASALPLYRDTSVSVDLCLYSNAFTTRKESSLKGKEERKVVELTLDRGIFAEEEEEKRGQYVGEKEYLYSLLPAVPSV